MARLPRLAIGGLPHLVVQRGHNGAPVFIDDEDRRRFLAALREVALLQRVAVHGYVLLTGEVWLLVTPEQGEGLSRMMQALGRRYVAGFNARHGRSGTLWDGRFRAAPLDAASEALPALLFIETLAQQRGAGDWSSLPHHLGRARDPLLSAAPFYWALGNTPFDRESVWRRQLEEGLPVDHAQRLEQAARKGWALGSPAFLAQWAQTSERPLVPRPRGRPRKAAPG